MAAPNDIVQGPLTPQQPVLSQNPTDILTDVAAAQMGPDNLPIEPLIRYQEIMRQKSQADNIEKAQQTLGALDEQQGGFMPKFIATMAALKGDFRPLMTLEEQKRKTAIGKAVFPIQMQVNELTNQGDWEGASNLAKAAYASAGARSPELVPFFQQMQKQISETQADINNMVGVHKMYDKIVPKDHPMRKFVDMLGDYTKHPTPMMQATFENILRANLPHTQFQDGQLLSASQTTGDMTTRPIPLRVQPSDTNNYSGLKLAASMGVNHIDLANFMSGRPMVTDTGETIVPDSPKGMAVKKVYNQAQQIQAQLEISKLVGIDPTQTLMLLHAGATPEQIATKMIPQDVLKAGLGESYKRDLIKAIMPTWVNLHYDPASGQKAGLTYIDMDPASPTFYQEVPYQTAAQVIASGGLMAPVRHGVIDKEVKPVTDAIKQFDYGVGLINRLGDVNTPAEQLDQAGRDLISRWLGTTVDKATLQREVARTILNRAIEKVSETGAIDAAEVGRLKSYIVGPLATTDDLRKVAIDLQGRLKERLSTAGMSKYPQDALPADQRKGAGPIPPQVPTDLNGLINSVVGGNTPVQRQNAPKGEQSDTSVYTPKGGGRIPKGAAVTKGDVEGALKRHGAAPVPVGNKEAERHMKWLQDHGYLQEVPGGDTSTSTPATVTPTAPTATPSTGIKKGTLR